MANPLHLCAEENGISSLTRRCCPGHEAPIALLVTLPTLPLATKSPSRRRSSASSFPCSGYTAMSSRSFVVNVPVLSMHSISTLLSDSIAFACCTSAPILTMRTAPSVSATAITRISPMGLTRQQPLLTSNTNCGKHRANHNDLVARTHQEQIPLDDITRIN